MEKLAFSIDINAPAQKVWDVLWNDVTYPQWTAVFSEGSHAESDWKEGSKVLFWDGKGNGMFSKIKTLEENRSMVFEHLGEISNGVEKPQEWGGATESYFLSEKDGTTALAVELFGSEDHKDYFKDIFPKALNIVKALSEKA